MFCFNIFDRTVKGFFCGEIIHWGLSGNKVFKLPLNDHCLLLRIYKEISNVLIKWIADLSLHGIRTVLPKTAFWRLLSRINWGYYRLIAMGIIIDSKANSPWLFVNSKGFIDNNPAFFPLMAGTHICVKDLFSLPIFIPSQFLIEKGILRRRRIQVIA